MRKLFLLISILTLSIAVNAATINITPTSPYGENDNLRKAVYYAAAGDEIVLADGTYFEPYTGGYLALNKSLTIKAAEGAHPVVQMEAYAQLTASAKVKFQGIKFDGSVQGSYEYYFRAYDVSASSLIFENCEFYDIKNEVFRAKSDVHMDSLIVNNCYFHNNKKNIVYFEASGTEGRQTCDKLVFTNSTVAKSDSLKNYTSTIDIKPYGTSNTDAIKVIIDHCTFYDNPTINTDHSAIRPYHLTDVTISNCIFVKGPNQKQKRNATSCYGGNINNCLVCGLDHSSSGHQSGPTVTGNIVADPLFNDLANNRYTYDGNWSTGSISPARGTATDGSDLGDPRWYTDEIIPSTNIASLYFLEGSKAKLEGNIFYSAVDSLHYENKSVNGIAYWKIHAERKCMINATVNYKVGSASGTLFKLVILDAEKNQVGDTLRMSRHDGDGNKLLTGSITIPDAGDYTIKLINTIAHSSGKINGVTLSYVGGAVQDISTSANTTLNVADAWFSGCTRDNDKTYIQYPSSETSSAWIKWNIATSETKYYDLTVNVNTEYAHGFTATIYEDEETAPVASVTEGSFVNTTGDGLALELGRVNLIGGKNYVVKVTNAPNGSQAKVTSVVFAPVVASATALPGTLAFSNAVLSEKANITDGMLYFNEPGADKDPRGEWAQWEVTTDHGGLFLFTMGVTSTNGQNYKITIKDDGDNVLDYYEASYDSGDKTIKHYFALNTGTYFVKVENTRSYSKGHLTSLVVTEPAGVVTLDEADTNTDAWSDKVVDKDAEGPLYDVQIIRTIKAGMYNTICLPFEVTSAQAKEIFGSDVQLRTLESATIEEGDFVLNLNFTSTSSMYQGTPHLIKTSRDIVNPVFIGVKFTEATPGTSTASRANLKGNFVKGTIPASENNLFLGANNTLYFPTVDTEIKGMRAYFIIHDAPAGAIKRARIVEGSQVATDIELVESQEPQTKSQKMIVNGQLYIMYEGQMYNVQGLRIK